MAKLAYGVYDLIARKLKAYTTSETNPLVSSVPTSVTKILKEDPTRIAVIIINLGGFPLYVGFEPDVSPTKGIRVAQNGGFFTMWWEEDFDLVANAMWAIADGGTVNIYVKVLKIYKPLEE